MIIPAPKDLPPRASVEAGKLSAAIHGNLNAATALRADGNSMFKQLNSTLESLAQQVLALEDYIGDLPAETDIYTTETTSFTLSTSYSTIASLSIPVPTGYTKTTLMVVADGLFKDPTTPYMTDTLVRISINGVNSQAMSTSWSATPAVGAADCWHIADTATVNGTANIPVSVSGISNVAVESSAETFARLSVFAIYNQ